MKVSFCSLFVVGGTLLSSLFTECNGLFHHEKTLQSPTSQRYHPPNFEGDEAACLSRPNPLAEYNVRGGFLPKLKVPPMPGEPGYEERVKRVAKDMKSAHIGLLSLLFIAPTVVTWFTIDLWKKERSLILIEGLTWLFVGFLWTRQVIATNEVFKLKYSNEPVPKGTKGKRFAILATIATSIASVVAIFVKEIGKSPNPDRAANVAVLAFLRIFFVSMMSFDSFNPFVENPNEKKKA